MRFFKSTSKSGEADLDTGCTSFRVLCDKRISQNAENVNEWGAMEEEARRRLEGRR